MAHAPPTHPRAPYGVGVNSYTRTHTHAHHCARRSVRQPRHRYTLRAPTSDRAPDLRKWKKILRLGRVLAELCEELSFGDHQLLFQHSQRVTLAPQLAPGGVSGMENERLSCVHDPTLYMFG